MGRKVAWGAGERPVAWVSGSASGCIVRPMLSQLSYSPESKTVTVYPAHSSMSRSGSCELNVTDL